MAALPRALLRLLHDPSPSVRGGALQAIRAGPARAPEGGEAALFGSRGEAEREADALRMAVADMVSRDADPGCRAGALAALCFLSPLADVECVEIALMKLSDRCGVMRLAAVEALSSIARAGDGKVLKTLVASLNDGGAGVGRAGETRAVRVAMVRAVGVLVVGNDIRVTACLSEVAERDGDPAVREAALGVLLSLGKVNIVDAVRGKEREARYEQRGVRRADGVHQPCTSMREALPLCRRDVERGRGARGGAFF